MPAKLEYYHMYIQRMLCRIPDCSEACSPVHQTVLLPALPSTRLFCILFYRPPDFLVIRSPIDQTHAACCQVVCSPVSLFLVQKTAFQSALPPICSPIHQTILQGALPSIRQPYNMLSRPPLYPAICSPIHGTVP
jgi:hypothetical protein